MHKFSLKPRGLPALILRFLLTAGNIYFASANPHRFLRMIGTHGSAAQEKEWAYLQRPLYQLRKKEYISMKVDRSGEVRLTATNRGRAIARAMEAAMLSIRRPRQWDGIWRVVIFDVPNAKSANRIAFSQRLKTLGFRMIQKSVWVFPHECKKELDVMKKFYDIEKHVLYIESHSVEGLALKPRSF